MQFTTSRRGSPVIPKATPVTTNGAAKVPDIINALQAKADEM